MSKIISPDDAALWLASHDNYLILTHVRPDGDTLGCAGALAQSLREMGKAAYVLINHQTTPRYAPYVQQYWAPDGYTPDYIAAVDVATLKLIPENASSYIDRISLCIDHHGTNTNYAQLVCCQPDTAACGEIVYDIVKQMLAAAGKSISRMTAGALYVAIATDTGCFCYRNTTARTHTVAAELIKLGAPNDKLNKLLFRTKRQQRIKIEGLIVSNIEYSFGGKVAIIVITRDMMQLAGADEDDIDDISNYTSSIEGVGIGITIREMSSPVDCKISVRAAPPYNASEICAAFGGGGHKAAAGAHFHKTTDEIKQDLLAVLEKYLQEFSEG